MVNQLPELTRQDCCCLCESYYWTAKEINGNASNQTGEVARREAEPSAISWLAVGALGASSARDRQSK
jgi:hypothetical protein